MTVTEGNGGKLIIEGQLGQASIYGALAALSVEQLKSLAKRHGVSVPEFGPEAIRMALMKSGIQVAIIL